MKLLITTQKVDKDDPILGFFHRWLEEFAKNFEQVIVICLEERSFNLPDNVCILSLGKEVGNCKVKYILNFYKYIWLNRKKYDAVFVHMNPEYVILGGLFWHIWRKKIILWYTHKSVNFKLKIAEKLANSILTASRRSFRLPSKKLKIIGHGIDLELFTPSQENLNSKIILQVGRISETKGQLILIKAFAKIINKIPEATLCIVGSIANESDKKYKEEVTEYIEKHNLKNIIKLLGPMPNNKIPEILQKATILVNTSYTGSLDKDVLEAMACNVHPISINEAFKDILPQNNFINSIDELPDKIIFFLNSQRRNEYRKIIAQEHSLQLLIKNIKHECAA